jgi:gamma-glutamyltranspeptidase
VSGLVDLGRDVRAAVGAPRWFVEPDAHFAPPTDVRAEPRFATGLLDELRARGHPVEAVAAFDGRLGHCHAIELVGGGPAVADGSLAAATDPRSHGLPAVR